MELAFGEKQLILYTKGHFGEINYKQDLKYFVSELYHLYPKDVNGYNEVGMVVGLYETLVEMGYIRFNLKTFLSDVFKRGWHEKGRSEVEWDHVLKQILAEIQNMQVSGFKEGDKRIELEIGEADLSILTKHQIEQDVTFS